MDFFRSILDEMKKVEWLKREEVVRYSWNIILFLLATALAVALLDIFIIKTRGALVQCLPEKNAIACFRNLIIKPVNDQISNPENNNPSGTGSVVDENQNI